MTAKRGIQRTVFTIGSLSMTDAPPVPDQQMMTKGPDIPIQQRAQLHLHLLRTLRIREADAPGNPEYVGIHGNLRISKAAISTTPAVF